jgi:hypothetical protein
MLYLQIHTFTQIISINKNIWLLFSTLNSSTWSSPFNKFSRYSHIEDRGSVGTNMNETPLC